MADKKIQFNHFIHGADYNPEQWLRYPEILKEDIRLMKEANMNSATVGIFSWAHLEPQEGVYNFDWLEEIINNLYENGIYTVLSTPSAAKPLWMSEKYEEVRRVTKAGVRDLSGIRHNHCYTSPYYRKKVYEINKALAERFSKHPGLILWHISNEYSGECYCELCRQEFINWLKEKYKTIDELNHAWWSDFWSHTYGDFSQIRPPMLHGEMSVHGLSLDWKRFVTHQTVDFCKEEIKAIREFDDKTPTTANLMGFYDGLDYFKFKDVIDVVSWDNYPWWHNGDNVKIAQRSACSHDLMRGIKGENFLIMENTPSCVNWTPVSKLKRDGVHHASALQALAHGSNSIQYFQFRKSRGSFEKFHGAVVDHVGNTSTREFRDVKAVGETLNSLSDMMYESKINSEVAIMYDWENRWAVEESAGPRRGESLTEDGGVSKSGMHYVETVLKHHRAFWDMGINVDIINYDCDIFKYKVLVAPMLYMYKNGIQDKMREFVKNGGTLISTYHSGIVNETDLCFLGGWPGEMMDVFGVWNESIDGLWDEDKNYVSMTEDAPFKGKFEVRELCALIHTKGAKVLAKYDEDFYKDYPALTVNDYEKGKAYYLAANIEQKGLNELYAKIAQDTSLERALPIDLPFGVSAHKREGEKSFIFVENYLDKEIEFALDKLYTDLINDKQLNYIKLSPFEVRVLSV